MLPRPCRYFSTRNGCRSGDLCPFTHDVEPTTRTGTCTCGHVWHLNESEANTRSHLQSKKHWNRLQELERSRAGTSTSGGAAAQQTESADVNHWGIADGSPLVEAADNDNFDAQDVIVDPADGLDFGIVEEEDLITGQFELTNVSGYQVEIRNCEIESYSRGEGEESSNPFSCSLTSPLKWLRAGQSCIVAVEVRHSYAGVHEASLQLNFVLRGGQEVIVTRSLSATMGSKDDQEFLRPKEPYNGKKKKKYVPLPGVVFRAARPAIWSVPDYKIKLPWYVVPKGLVETVFGPATVEGDGDQKRDDKQAFRELGRYLPGKLEPRTYVQFFQTLLWVEEEQNRRNLEDMMMTEVALERKNEFYDVEIPGNVQRQIGLLVGNFVQVSHSNEVDDPTNGKERKWYEGRIQRINEERIALGFGEGFSTYRGNIFDVRFVLNRMPHRRMHYAIRDSYPLDRLVFPGYLHQSGINMLPNQMAGLSYIDEEMVDNEEQKEAVTAIVNRQPGTVPFIIFGPPGTGKTVTLVEAIQQILEREPNARILACTPSNKAADVITRRLTDLGTDQLFRINAMWRPVNEYDQELRPFSMINKNDIFEMPTAEDLEKFRVVVATCVSAGVIVGLGVERGHFSHIFIDEAGQASEPESMIPIRGLSDDQTVVVLAGDNQQLGPVVFSPLARSYGFGKSFLARLMDLPVYGLDGPGSGRGTNIVKLVKNFRSNGAILEFPNEEFYARELRACGDPKVIRKLENHKILPKRGYPVIFHSVIGKDQQEKDNPSYFNIEEATVVRHYCEQLLGTPADGLKPSDIGVITPYRAQCDKLIRLFRRHSTLPLREIKVGSVEEFQGDERMVIILSTVRGKPSQISSDIRNALGFVANKFRMNVAITRARALQIIVGNADVLGLDPLWHRYLTTISLRGGWVGKSIPWHAREAEDDEGGEFARVRAEIAQTHIGSSSRPVR
ncbi:P-loop containing nucleoside triphosphate hydrolase protein [Pluteus cervinus]|uniref:P-loop containing nucleoside triphosphate hydrolase protein n=1 Tax=Pluteus cervinus TaxID=181527 RepID=A0ACD3A6V8_9AGAR|nr:P-loop containing nucleoside triphosphate hydrolase protein [Pluteus cervinus]